MQGGEPPEKKARVTGGAGRMVLVRREGRGVVSVPLEELGANAYLVCHLGAVARELVPQLDEELQLCAVELPRAPSEEEASSLDYCEDWQPPNAAEPVSQAAMSSMLSTLFVAAARLSRPQMLCLMQSLLTLEMMPAAWSALGRLLCRGRLDAAEKSLLAQELYALCPSFEELYLWLAHIRSEHEAVAQSLVSVETISTHCARSHERLVDPVTIQDNLVVSRAHLKDGDVIMDANMRDLSTFLLISERRTSFVFRVAPGELPAAPAVQIPSVFRRRNRDSVFRVIPPLSLKQAAHPCLARFATGLISVCTSGGGGCGGGDATMVRMYTPVAVENKTDHKCDPQSIATLLNEQGVDDSALDDRLAEELIVVCLDTSKSMSKRGFPEPGFARAARYDDEQHAPEVSDSPEETARKILEDSCYDLYKNIIRSPAGRRVALYRVYDHPSARVSDWQAVLQALNSAGSNPSVVASDLFLCPITGEPFGDPVITADGHSYERSAIEQWFARGKRTSPLTGAQLEHTQLIPNHALKAGVLERKEKQLLDAGEPFEITVEVWTGCVEAKLHRVGYLFRSNQKLRDVTITVPFGATKTTLLHVLHEQAPVTTLAYDSAEVGSGELLRSRYHPGRAFVLALHPTASALVDRRRVNINLGDTPFRLLYQLYGPNAVTMSLWSGFSSAGDGHRVGTLWDRDDSAMYRKCAEASSPIEFELEKHSSPEGLRRMWDANQKNAETYLSRLDVANSAFQSFMDRTSAYDHPHRAGLTKFSSTAMVMAPISSLIDSFRGALARLSPSGDTALYDALENARVQLLAAKADLENKQLISPACKLRIICLTDGKDTSSRIHKDQVIRNLRADNIVVDGLSIGLESRDLLQLTYASGGLCFAPTNMEQLMSIMELETFLRLTERDYSVPANPALHYSNLLMDTATGPERPRRKGEQELQSFKVRSGPIANIVARSTRTARIMAELNAVMREKHPAYSCFLSEDDLTLWKVVMCGPEGTPYEGGVFQLAVQFPEAYPQEPPIVRFITPVLHCNTNSYGKICHSILGKAYDSEYSMSDVLNCVYGLLLTPETSEPIDVMLAALYTDNTPAYEAKIAAHVRLFAARQSLEQVMASIGS